MEVGINGWMDKAVILPKFIEIQPNDIESFNSYTFKF